MSYEDRTTVDVLLGKTVKNIQNNNNAELIFELESGEKYTMYHSQDCCESVYLESITGDLQDLIGTPILKAEERTSNDKIENVEGLDEYSQSESFTWTFYHFATIKGYVDLRWLGESNGYYSESVDFELIKEN